MFENLLGSLSDLDAGTRVQLADFLADRIAFTELNVELDKRRIALLANPSPTAELALAEYASEVVNPARRKLGQQGFELAKQSVDVDQLMSMLPMVLMALTQSVDVTLLLTVLGIDPDSIKQITSRATEYFGSRLNNND